MLPVKLLRSLVLGEAMNIPFLPNDDDPHAHDADDEEDDDTNLQRRSIIKEEKLKKKKDKYNNDRKRLPLLLFTPTGELISDTFKLAAIARDIGMDFHPTPSLSHLIFSWPSPTSPSTPSSSSSSSSSYPSSWASSSTPSTSSPFSFDPHRPSTSSTSSSTTTTLLPNDAVPLPFPSLSSPTTSLSLLRYFVSLSKGLFKLVFFNPDPDTEIRVEYYSDCDPPVFLHSRVSGRRVGSMDEFSKELAGYGWTLFRTRQNPKCPGLDSVYLFRKKEVNRLRAGFGSGGGNVNVGECRVRELRLPALEFKRVVPIRILMYILLMTDDVFYLA